MYRIGFSKVAMLMVSSIWPLVELDPTPAISQIIREDFPATNGAVDALAISGNTLYIGGRFTQVGPATGGGVPLQLSNGLPVSGFPKVIGSVFAVAPDGLGGWYIGGWFSSVGGFPRNNIAHIDANNAVSPWNPDADNQVWALATGPGVVYAGGMFSAIGGQTRYYIAALDAANGSATSWNPGANTWVNSLTVSGTTVYVAGWFNIISGQTRKYIAALDAESGLALPWNPSANDRVYCMALGNGVVYVGGQFSTIGGSSRIYIAALDAISGSATAWSPNANGVVDALLVCGGIVYAGGGFTNIGGMDRNRLAALDEASGVPTPWHPNADARVTALHKDGSVLCAGGYFTSIGGAARSRLAALDVATGLATAWDPRAGREVLVLAGHGPIIYAGGNFTIMGGQERNRLAAVNIVTGEVTSWSPSANADVLALAVNGGTVYAGGNFTSINGTSRYRVAAFDAVTGALANWNPSANGSVKDLLIDGNRVFACGNFEVIGGAPRANIAALDDATGGATTWAAPYVEFGDVLTMDLENDILYVGGLFASGPGFARNRLAALDATTGQLLAWDPNANNDVYRVTVDNGTVYVGGAFTTVGGANRRHIAALSAATGEATGWDPSPGGGGLVIDIEVMNGAVYAAGMFVNIGGQVRNRIAALDPITGLATDWNPNANFTVATLAVSGGTVFAGGGFTAMGNLPQSYLAAIVEDQQCSVAAEINQSPRSQGVFEGQSVEFSVATTGTPPLFFQWRKNGLDISGASGSVYSIESATRADEGYYDVVVSNYCGSDSSDAAELVVCALDAGKALSFDGGDYVRIPEAPSLDSPDYSSLTYEFWLYLETNPNVFHVLGKRGDCNTGPLTNYQVGRDDNLGFHGGRGDCVAGLGSEALQNQWTHYAFTFSPTQCRIYVNGNLVSQQTSVGAPTNPNDEPFWIGASGTCAGVRGVIDEVRMWNVVRSPEEILAFHNRLVDPNTTGLVGYWGFDEADADQNVYDASPFGNHGLLGGDPGPSAADPVRVPSGAPVLTCPTSEAGGPPVRPVQPVRFLGPPHPNPASGQADIRLSLPEARVVRLSVFDVRGVAVRTLASGLLEGGDHEFRWNGRNAEDEKVPSGLYFMRLEAGDRREMRRLVLIR